MKCDESLYVEEPASWDPTPYMPSLKWIEP